MRRVLAVLVLAAASLPVWPGANAWACSCVESTRRDDAQRADAVFVGLARDAEPIDGAATALATRFSVEAVYKGDLVAGSDVSILHETQGSACGLTFPDGVTCTVLAYKSDGALWANLCWATTRGRIPARQLGLPRPDSVIPATPETEGIDADDSRLPWLFVVLGVVGVGVTAGLVLRRRSA